MFEIPLVVIRVCWGIITEWWIVCLFLLSIEGILAGWILFLVGVHPAISLTIMALFTSIAIGIPFREQFLVGEGSVMERFKEKYLVIEDQNRSQKSNY